MTSLHEKSLILGLESLMRHHSENEEDKQSSLSQGGLGRAGPLRPKHLQCFLVCKEKPHNQSKNCFLFIFVFIIANNQKRYYLEKLFRTRAVWREDSSLFCSWPGFSPSQQFIKSEQPLHVSRYASIFHAISISQHIYFNCVHNYF